MLRPRANTLLAMSAAIFIAAIGGVTLGRSAVGAINPLYFEGAAPPPRAVDGTIREPAQPAYYQAYNWEQGNYARLIACGDNCGPPEPYDPYALAEIAPPQRLAGTDWRDTTPSVELAPWPPGEVMSHRDRGVERYTDFSTRKKPADAEDEGGRTEPSADDQQADVYDQ